MCQDVQSVLGPFGIHLENGWMPPKQQAFVSLVGEGGNVPHAELPAREDPVFVCPDRSKHATQRCSGSGCS